ncbi:hypothetical protein [Pontibacter lucknowensis]|uniref:Uncharacterized protein n=1 Tax=Pontibacter lucknowensis TaxID=1077936 RepID=A0A1N6WFN9_9BACT|nr:hypothetical protein [Pontibacter lucknowensis]SIQ88967.1 hypothetical protein SAMN05421545_1515 [Pontibacter lucknowensis]
MNRYNNWQDRRDENRRDNNRNDESQYRGAYRLDEDSHYSTYNRSGQGDRDRDRYNEDQGGDYIYRRSRNLQDNDDYTQRQYQQSYRGGSRQGAYSDFGGRYGGSAGMRDNRSGYNDPRSSERSSRQQYGDHYVNRTSGNFDGDYRPDNYPHRRDENYGNMAGSLSFGYDGDRNSDPDYNRRYNPMTGEMRERQRDYEQRQPRRYGPPDRTGSNPDYDRY